MYSLTVFSFFYSMKYKTFYTSHVFKYDSNNDHSVHIITTVVKDVSSGLGQIEESKPNMGML